MQVKQTPDRDTVSSKIRQALDIRASFTGHKDIYASLGAVVRQMETLRDSLPE